MLLGDGESSNNLARNFAIDYLCMLGHEEQYQNFTINKYRKKISKGLRHKKYSREYVLKSAKDICFYQ